MLTIADVQPGAPWGLWGPAARTEVQRLGSHGRYKDEGGEYAMLCELEKRFDAETIADIRNGSVGIPAPNMPKKDAYLMYPVPKLKVGLRTSVKRKRGIRLAPRCTCNYCAGLF